MATSLSNSTLFHRPPFNPNHNSTTTLFRHPPAIQFSIKATSKDPNNITTPEQPPLTSPSEKRSFAVATGELFLGIASRIIKNRNAMERGLDSEEKVLMFGEELGGKKESYFWSRSSNRKEPKEEEIAAVVDDGDVVWEQRLKDVEAERDRKAVTSPGFSFSAAGLLFPYHLGVAKFLIEKGYIKDTTPLAGSSAGAIVCAVVASGASMEEALQATKILAQDCRSRGTAFRLGAVLREVLESFLPEDAHIRSDGRLNRFSAILMILMFDKGRSWGYYCHFWIHVFLSRFQQKKMQQFSCFWGYFWKLRRDRLWQLMRISSVKTYSCWGYFGHYRIQMHLLLTWQQGYLGLLWNKAWGYFRNCCCINRGLELQDFLVNFLGRGAV